MNATEIRSIKCAHCKEYHPSIDAVRQCSKIEQAQRVFMESTPASTQRATADADRSLLIEPVPAGRYAVPVDGTLGFYKVDTPVEGRWRGKIFVAQMASDDEHPVLGRRKHLVLALIRENPQAAMLRYGREIGSCGHCGRTLTNEVSRLAGIGPVCRTRMGW